MKQPHDISACIRGALEEYFKTLEGEKPSSVYNMVIKCVERPMLEVLLKECGGNQSVAAQMLGINRNTLRKKLIEHDLL